MKHKVIIAKTAIHLVSLYLIINVYYLAINDNLGADPVEEVLHFTGMGSLNLLVIGLLISPLAKRFKQAWLIKLRRLVGLYAFFYANCHILSFWAFEIQFDLVLFIDEIVERPYITVGMLVFTILVPLAITSWSKVKKRMGKRWQLLHNWVYLAVFLAAVHFYWSVKSDITEPLIYLTVIVLLLLLRRHKVKKFIR